MLTFFPWEMAQRLNSGRKNREAKMGKWEYWECKSYNSFFEDVWHELQARASGGGGSQIPKYMTLVHLPTIN
jgi:hypothetical protein